ncbi:MAG TPA: ribonuclease III [Casimicrobiaceae bacterium]|nr:ribonuclease III [Casimicrobiaceae bacterium]
MADTLRERLGYAFRDPDLLRHALTHRSYGASHNERLEFVGDAVLNCVVGALLYARFPSLAEGDLSRVRASLVNQEALARVARSIALGADVKLGEGEQKSGGADRASILADALEAVFGAVFLDGGFDAAHKVIVDCYGEVLAGAHPALLGKDPKTRLQEWLQGRRMAVPEYAVVATTGEAHAQTFEVECRVPAIGLVVTGRGGSRRAAEQAAAEIALGRVARHADE